MHQSGPDDTENGLPEPPPEAEDQSPDELLESAFPPPGDGAPAVPLRPIFAVIPAEVVHASPQEFSLYLESVFAAGDELEAAIDHSLAPVAEDSDAPGRRLLAVVPAEVMASAGGDPSSFLEQVFDAFDEIDQVLASLREETGTVSDRFVADIAVVPEEVIGDPVELMRSIDRVEGHAAKLALLLRQAKHCLKRLHRYRLSRRPPGAVITDMRTADDVPTLQFLVDFVRSIYVAADSFEALELPRPHIRDYLEHLYRMEDWDELSSLVRRLQQAVLRYSRHGG